MLLMGLMSLVLFLGGLFSPEAKLPADPAAKISNEGLLRPTFLSQSDTDAFTDGLFLFFNKENRLVVPQRVKQQPLSRLHQEGFADLAVPSAVPPMSEQVLPAFEKAHVPYPGWDGPIPFALPPPLAV